MKDKTRSDSLLSQLTEEQQAQVYDWLMTLGYRETVKKLAQPPPEGYDLQTHRNSLLRFFKRYQRTVRTEDVAAARESRFNPEDESVLVSDAERSFLHAGHQLATGPMNPADFSKVGRWLDSRKEDNLKRFYARLAEQNAGIGQRKAALAERRLELDCEKFRFNAARQALIHFAELAKIARKRDIDNEDKIRAAADLLFRPSQNALPKPETNKPGNH